LLVVRELDERLGLSELISDNLTDARRGRNTQLPLPDLLRQSIYSRLAGYEDLNDAKRLSQDPTFRLIGSEKIRDRGAALSFAQAVGRIASSRRLSLYGSDSILTTFGLRNSEDRVHLRPCLGAPALARLRHCHTRLRRQ
jgi:hypothetical protein